MRPMSPVCTTGKNIPGNSMEFPRDKEFVLYSSSVGGGHVSVRELQDLICFSENPSCHLEKGFPHEPEM